MKKTRKEIYEKLRKYKPEINEKEILFDTQYGDFSVRLKTEEKISLDENFEKVEKVGDYVNFFLKKKEFAKCVLDESLNENFGEMDVGMGKTVIIDFSSPNIARPLHAGHLSSTIIGEFLARLHEFCGFKVIRWNYLGDWGTTQGKIIYEFKKYGDLKRLEKERSKYLLELYRKFEEEKTPEIEEKARQEFASLERGDLENKKMWNLFRQKTIEDLEKVYERLGVKFDIFEGESSVAEKAKEIISEALSKKKAVLEEDNSVIIPLEEYGLTNALLRKKDESTLYLSREIAMVKERFEKYNCDEILYVVGKEQKMHFEQLKKCLEVLGYNFWEKIKHIDFGHLRLQGKKMSAREGELVFVEDILDEAKSKCEKIGKNAELVGLGAVKFAILSQSRKKDIDFSWEKMTSLSGDSGPYLQYALVRCKSILKKISLEDIKGDIEIPNEIEFKVIKQIAKFPEVIENSLKNYDSSELSQYLLKIVHDFSKFYETCSVLGAETQKIKSLRVKIVLSVHNILTKGLFLLGIPILEEM
ncbi:MAG: arginine--tRNA ligase [archaeon]